MQNEIAAMQKKYKQLQKSKQQLEKSWFPPLISLLAPLPTNDTILLDSRASKSAPHWADPSDEENGYESEEADPPSGKGFFAQQVCSGLTCYITTD